MKDKKFKKLVKQFDPDYPKKPSLKNLTSPEWSLPSGNPSTQFLGTPHVESFNFATGPGLQLMVENLEPVEFLFKGDKVSFEITDAAFSRPEIPEGALGSFSPLVYPSEARQRGTNYKALFTIQLKVRTNGGTKAFNLNCPLGHVPIMVKSNVCNLSKLSPSEMVDKGEHPGEWGGYFIIRGHERLIRMLISTRKNYPIAMCRPSWKKRGKHFSEYGIQLECSTPDLTTTKNVLHFVTTGSAKLMFSFRRELYFAPVVMILKCLSERTDADIYAHLISGTSPEDHYYRSCIKSMLTEPHGEGLYSSEQIRKYIGKSFKDKLKYSVPEWSTDEDVCRFLIKQSVCIHLKNDEDKFQMIVFMIKKLFALVQNRCVVEGVDSPMMQEVTIGGHLYLQLIKDKLVNWLSGLKTTVSRKAEEDSEFQLNPNSLMSLTKKLSGLDPFMSAFLGTGNLPSSTYTGLMQNAGLTIMAENINRMRYMSHFRAVHRGSFFQEMRTTEVRALLPDAWGFICPVHTPDGSPCGLLNHLTLPTEIITHAPDASKVPSVLYDLGVLPVDQIIQAGHEKESEHSYSVILDGMLLGYVLGTDEAKDISDKLRVLKVRSERGIPRVMEIVFIPYDDNPKLQGQYPGLFLFTGAARMMRPVVNIAADHVEYIGTFEQVFLNICIQPDEAYPGITTHREIRSTNFLSNLASLIPLPDFNQSPRNMYQCQMGKQTMATPIHTWHLNSETKIYRLQTPASPFFRPVHYDYLKMDEFPMGTNAIVAVISYTGYDMEDAMIINKSSFERGFCAGSIYKSQFIDLKELSSGKKNSNDIRHCEFYFQRDPARELAKYLDADGLPYPGIPLNNGDPLYCYRNSIDDTYMVKKYDGNEVAFVDSVKILSNDTGTSDLNRVSICYRIPRNPSVGDKFASRAGQKGICSRKWITEDLPWTESGIHPDIIFNPHGFPSRMTIAMMVECMAGKSGAAHGLVHDATPFTFSEDNNNDAIDFFGKQLESAGYNYYGTETMYSGTDGVEMKAEIFFGVIHYQRLRHMVSDKFQVRSKGPVDQVTRQPIKGRRRGGGVRFGEMERDALLSHGSMFLLQDRLFHGSDKTRVKICTRCGSLLSPRVTVSKKMTALGGTAVAGDPICVICKKGDNVSEIDLPYVFLHLVAQLAGVNIKVRLETTHN